MPSPNILLITTDQQHHRMASYAGDRYVSTPNLDRLAAEGKRFELTYCANPVCVPSRYAMISGHRPHVFGGLEHNFTGRAQEQPRIADYVNTPAMGPLMGDLGYEVYAGGKLHVEAVGTFTPEKAEEYGFQSLTTDSRDDLAHCCADFLEERNSDRPFFLWASFINPHDICSVLDEDGKPRHPTDLPDELPPLPQNFEPPKGEPGWLQGFRDGTLGEESRIELGLNRRFGTAATRWTDDDWSVYRSAYRYYMTDLDRQLGIILEALERFELAETTVVLFTSDHGDHDGEHRLTMKRSFYEASSHVPLVIRWPGGVSPGSVDSSHLVNNGIDLLPTLCDFAGGSIPDALPGLSLKPLALDEHTGPWRDHIVAETVGGRMLRTLKYKYTLFHFDGQSEEMLVDMEGDPGETLNLVTDPAYQSVLADHRNKLKDWVLQNNDSNGITYHAAL